MSIQVELDRIGAGAFDGLLENQDPHRVLATLRRGLTHLEDLALLLSPGAQPVLEALAAGARTLTRRHFGHTMQLYAPLYVSDHCVNHCTYCGFRAPNAQGRRRLEPGELQREGSWLAREGFRNVLVVAGESPQHCPVAYLERVMEVLAPQVPLLGIEVQPLEAGEYARLHRAGVEYVTLYQETYDRAIYREVHPRGPKADYDHRLEALERAGQGGMNAVNLGVLLGLAPWRRDVLALGAHGRWLERRHPAAKVGFSLPRLRPAVGMAPPRFQATDRALVQALLALRHWMPAAELALSTRELPALRDGLMPLAVTKVSAGSRTSVGGYGGAVPAQGQFEISDDRSLETLCAVLGRMGLDPVLADWVPLRGQGVMAGTGAEARGAFSIA